MSVPDKGIESRLAAGRRLLDNASFTGDYRTYERALVAFDDAIRDPLLEKRRGRKSFAPSSPTPPWLSSIAIWSWR